MIRQHFKYSDRCAANHAAIRIVNSEWGKSLNELYCHLHPLDSIATSVRSALKKHKESRGTVFGKDCPAGNVILQMNKLQYKNGKGDPKGFVAFLDERNIPRGVLPQCRGNTSHILFHISGKLIEYYDDFATISSTALRWGTLSRSSPLRFCNCLIRIGLFANMLLEVPRWYLGSVDTLRRGVRGVHWHT